MRGTERLPFSKVFEGVRGHFLQKVPPARLLLFRFSALAADHFGVLLCRLFGLVFTVKIVLFSGKVGGQVGLPYVITGEIMRVAVAFEERRAQVHRHFHAAPCLNVGFCRRQRRISGVGFGRGGKHQSGVDEGNRRFGKAQFNRGLTARAGDCRRLRVGKTDVLGGDDLQAPTK